MGYAEANSGMLSLFELFVDLKEKQMDFRLSAWVTALVDHFKSLYGEEKGEWVARRIISYYIRDNETLH